MHRFLPSVLAASLAVANFAPAQTRPTDKADSDMAAVLAQLSALQPKDITQLPIAKARSQPSAADAVIQTIQYKGLVAPDRLPPVGRVETRAVPGPDGAPIPVRVYTPKGDGPFPVVVYYHGGGWVIADVDTYDSSCRAICDLAKAVVVAPEYRRAPEAKFPAAHEDSYATFQYVAENASSFGGNPNQVAVLGESAGGNLATAVCLMASQRNGKMPIAQVLVYPITNYAFDTQSYTENADAKSLNKAMMQWFYTQYLNSPDDGTDIRASPLRASPTELKRLPPATIITAEIDPLRDDGRQYAKKLKDAGVDVEAKDYEGVTHEFFGMAAVVDDAKAAEAFAAGRLKDAFDKAD